MDVLAGARGVPIKSWAPLSEVESEALVQLSNMSTLPCVFKHVAVMPDVHAGKGSTVGSVIATKGAVIPACVGVDIGCGMMAGRTVLTASHLPDSLSALRAEIERVVPVGREAHQKPHPLTSRWDGLDQFVHIPRVLHSKMNTALCQLGTLGGGNHFIEICLDTEQNVWVMLHSGSRHIGKAIADVYIEKAKGLMRKYFIDLPDPDLAYLAEETPEFNAYWRDLQWAQEYALVNRGIMMYSVLQAIKHVIPGIEAMPLFDEVNCHHNYVAREHHFGSNVLVTRKGAVRARAGELGIIPGSMGAKSYIVRGLGNPESFHSCSHGAGRAMSRTKAKATFTVQDVIQQTEGVECKKDLSVLDEIPGAYKDIDRVMANQKDLVEVVAELKQILCVKG